MSAFLYSDAEKTLVDDLLSDYLDDRDDIAYPVVLPVDGVKRVINSNDDLCCLLAPSLSDYAEEECGQTDDGVLDMERIFGEVVEKRLSEAYVLPDSGVDEKLWDDEAIDAYVRNFSGNFPQACFDEFGCLWQISSSMAMLDMFIGYVLEMWGRKKDLDACWEVFASSCDLTDAATLIGKHLEGDIIAIIEERGGLHNPCETGRDWEAGFIEQHDGAGTILHDLDDLNEHIVSCARAASDFVPIFDFCAGWELFLRPGPSDLVRALDDLPAYIEGGWADYPYTCEKVDDEGVQMRICSGWDLLYFTCDCDINEWIIDEFPAHPLVSDLASEYLKGLDIYRRY